MKYGIIFSMCTVVMLCMACAYTVSNTVTESVDEWSGNVVRSTDCPWHNIGGLNEKACLDSRVTFVNNDGKPDRTVCVMILTVRNFTDWQLSSHDDLIIRADGLEYSLEPIPGHHDLDCNVTSNGILGVTTAYWERNEYSISAGDYARLSEPDSVDVRFSTPRGTYIMFTTCTDLFAETLTD